MAWHVSTKGLHVAEAPSLLHHRQLHPQDEQNWDEAYDEEYDGLCHLPTFEVITEKEYKTLKKLPGQPSLPWPSQHWNGMKTDNQNNANTEL